MIVPLVLYGARMIRTRFGKVVPGRLPKTLPLTASPTITTQNLKLVALLLLLLFRVHPILRRVCRAPISPRF